MLRSEIQKVLNRPTHFCGFVWSGLVHRFLWISHGQIGLQFMQISPEHEKILEHFLEGLWKSVTLPSSTPMMYIKSLRLSRPVNRMREKEKKSCGLWEIDMDMDGCLLWFENLYNLDLVLLDLLNKVLLTLFIYLFYGYGWMFAVGWTVRVMNVDVIRSTLYLLIIRYP